MKGPKPTLHPAQFSGNMEQNTLRIDYLDYPVLHIEPCQRTIDHNGDFFDCMSS